MRGLEAGVGVGLLRGEARNAAGAEPARRKADLGERLSDADLVNFGGLRFLYGDAGTLVAAGADRVTWSGEGLFLLFVGALGI